MDFNHHETPTKRSVSGSPSVDEEEEAEDAEVWEVPRGTVRTGSEPSPDPADRVADNMVKNVGLIQEINGNISKVVSLYFDLSSNFSTFFHHCNDNANANANTTN
ncbi:hypothetical protein ACE6H2_005622 [Prunus campanulata]